MSGQTSYIGACGILKKCFGTFEGSHAIPQDHGCPYCFRFILWWMWGKACVSAIFPLHSHKVQHLLFATFAVYNLWINLVLWVCKYVNNTSLEIEWAGSVRGTKTIRIPTTISVLLEVGTWIFLTLLIYFKHITSCFQVSITRDVSGRLTFTFKDVSGCSIFKQSPPLPLYKEQISSILLLFKEAVF